MPAAVCSASASSLVGIFLTPLLVGTVVANAGSAPISFDAVGKIMLQLLLPFVLGQFARRWIGAWVHKRKAMLKFVDQGSILLVVYTAFSEAINEGLWSSTPIPALVGLVVACSVILALALGLSAVAGKVLGFNVEDASRCYSAARRRAWPAASRWRRCCSPATRWAPSCCR